MHDKSRHLKTIDTLALMAAVVLLCSAPHIAFAASAADCQEMERLANENMAYYRQHRDKHHLEAAQTYQDHARQCWASIGGSSSGGMTGGANRTQQRLQALQNVLQTLDSWARDREQRQRQENYRQADQANKEGNSYAELGDCAQAVAAYDRAISHLEANGDRDNLAVVIRNRDRCQRKLWAEERHREDQQRLINKQNSEQAIADLARTYKAAGKGLDCTPPNYDPKICNFSNADPIWKNVRNDVHPDWCLQNGGMWVGFAQYCVISPEKAAAAPPSEPKEANTIYNVYPAVEDTFPFLAEPPVEREHCSRGSCIYRNVSLSDCRLLRGLPYARPHDKGYAGLCSIGTSNADVSSRRYATDISLIRLPLYKGDGPRDAPISRSAYSGSATPNPWGGSTISGSTTSRARGGKTATPPPGSAQ